VANYRVSVLLNEQGRASDIPALEAGDDRVGTALFISTLQILSDLLWQNPPHF
jgi:hypothetical protein